MKIKKKTFIVSCQALADEPMFGKGIPIKMVRAALKGGAKVVRVSQIENVITAKKELKGVFIGLIKKKYRGSQVYITPTINELQALIKAGTPVIAIDATLRKRPQESLAELVSYFKNHKKRGQELMADCATIEEIVNADKLGFDCIGTTLRGYTEQTKGKTNVSDDFAFLKEARKKTKKFLIAEGGIKTPELAKRAMAIADAVVVGSAITRPDYITAMYVKHLKGD